MNRIICDICGAEYPETAERCPVCHYPRQGTEKLAAAEGEAVRIKVKGGRFSSKNVKKRQKAQRKAAQAREKNPNRPLIITIILLLIAIILVSAYIGVRFLRGRGSLPELRPQKTTAAATTLPTETTQPPMVPCEGLVLDSSVLDLEEPGEQKQLAVMAVPENTTDAITYVSADPSVAEVTQTGLITAVGSGQTTITITCGGAVKTCTVVCWFQEETTTPVETTQPTEPKATEPQPTQPKATEPKNLTLDQTDVSFFSKNESFTIYVKLGDTDVSRSKVTWTSSDPKVATVENGTVTAVGKGTATITAEYDGKKAECVVRCRFEDAQETEGRQEEPKDTAWKASHSDVSIAVGESFRLTVKNADGKTADAIWTQSQEGVVSVDGKTVTGRAPGTVTLTTTVEGVTLTCIVRVK